MAASEAAQCGACQKPLPESSGRGRRRMFCNAACRAAAHRSRACQLRVGPLRCPEPATIVLTCPDASDIAVCPAHWAAAKALIAVARSGKPQRGERQRESDC
jgi:hypothetical protein